MKIYISADMEGICGPTSWDDVTPSTPEYQHFRQQMSAEVAAACRGAIAAGAEEVVVKDAHDTGRNIIAAELPEQATLIHGWSRHPYCMMQDIDNTFNAAIMVGYHTFAGGEGNPLAHTMNTSRNSSVLINGKLASEFLINCYTALYERVPVVFISGDRELCDHAAEYVPEIVRVAVKSGSGDSTTNLHPKTAIAYIEEGVRAALGAIPLQVPTLPKRFEVTLNFVNHKDAYRCSFYPGGFLSAPRTVNFRADDWFEVLRFFHFTL